MKTKTINVTDLRRNLRETLEEVFNDECMLIVTRPKRENVVIISEKEYRRLEKLCQKTNANNVE